MSKFSLVFWLCALPAFAAPDGGVVEAADAAVVDASDADAATAQEKKVEAEKAKAAAHLAEEEARAAEIARAAAEKAEIEKAEAARLLAEKAARADAEAKRALEEEKRKPKIALAADAKAHVVSIHEQESPLRFWVPFAGKSAAERKAAAQKALTAVLDGDAEDYRVLAAVKDDVLSIRVGDKLIALMSDDDAHAEGFRTAEELGANLAAPLTAFIEEQHTRSSQQQFFLNFFFAIFALVLWFLLLRQVSRLFDRLDVVLDDKRGNLKPISILRTPVFSAEAVGGGLALASTVGRVVAYITAVVVTLAFVLSRFAFTRPIVTRLGGIGQVVLDGFEALLSSIPGLILAALLLLILRAGLRVMNILLDGVQSKRLKWKSLSPERVSPFRFAARTAAILLFLPLIVAAVFGGYDTPLGALALGAGLVVLVAAVPTLASYVYGIVILWRGDLRAGDWIKVGGAEGEVTGTNFNEVRLVPAECGIVIVPMLFLLLHPLRRLRSAPEVSFDVTVARDRPARELIEAMELAVKKTEPDANVKCVDICHAWLKIRVSAPSVRENAREQLLVAVADAVDRHEFELPVLHGKKRDPAT